MTALEDALAKISACLESLERPWALVGALAVAARAEARATLDVDVAVATEGPAESRAVIARLLSTGLRWHRDFGNAMTSFVILEGPPAGLRLDVLFSLSGIESEVARSATRIEILPGLTLPVAEVGDLIALKLLSSADPGREHDFRDLRSLIEKATPSAVERARSLIRLLELRGKVTPGQLGSTLETLLSSPKL